MNDTKAKKIISTTVKNFIKNNIQNLYVRTGSSFDGMTDCVQQNHDAAFHKVDPAEYNVIDCYSLGINGVWFVGRSRDYFNIYDKDGFVGYEVHNSCGSFVVAIYHQKFHLGLEVAVQDSVATAKVSNTMMVDV